MGRHKCRNAYLCGSPLVPILRVALPKGQMGTMNGTKTVQRLCLAAALFLAVVLARPALPAVRNIAVVMSAGTKLQDVQLAELVKLCKGTQKAWADGRSFLL